MKEILAFCALVFVVLTGLLWYLQGTDFLLYKVFAPQYEQVRHDTFKESQAYNDGMVNELAKMRADYEGAKSEGHKQALADLILHRASQYDETRLPPDLRAFIASLRRR